MDLVQNDTEPEPPKGNWQQKSFCQMNEIKKAERKEQDEDHIKGWLREGVCGKYERV